MKHPRSSESVFVRVSHAALAFVQHHLPCLRWLPQYPWRRDLASDTIAAAAEVIVATPEAIAYASIAGLRGENGLYAAMVGPLVYAFFGTSLQLLTGPTAVMSVLTASSMPKTWAGEPLLPGSEQYVQLAAALAFTVGLLQLGLYCLRAGFLTRLIGHPVMLGFVSGSAVLTASTQLANLLGVKKCVGVGGGSCTLGAAVANIAARASTVRWAAPVGSLLCIALLLLWKFWLPRCLPARLRWVRFGGPVVLVTLGIALMWRWRAELTAQGIISSEEVPAGLPGPRRPLPEHASAADVQSLILAAVPPTLIGYMESLTIAKAVARQTGPYEISDSQELFALSLANIATALGRGYPVTGSFSRTAVMAASGARSPVASFLAGLLVIPVLLLAAEPLSHLPKIVTAGIVAVYIVRLIQPGEVLRLWRMDKPDFLVFLLTFLLVVFESIGSAFMAGIGAQWLLAIARAQGSKSAVRVLQWSAGDAGTATPPDPPVRPAPSLGLGLKAEPAPLSVSSSGGGTPSRTAPASPLLPIPGELDPHALLSAVPALLLDAGPSLPAGVRFAVYMPRHYPAVAAALRAGWALREVRDAAALSDATAPRSVELEAAGAASEPAVAAVSDAAGAVGGAYDAPPAPAAAAGAFLVRIDEPGSAGEPAASPPPRTPSVPARVLVLRFEPDILFASAARLRSHADEAIACYGSSACALVLDLSAVSAVDSTGALAVFSLADHTQASRGVPVAAAGANPRVLGALLRAAAAHHSLSPEPLVPGSAEAAASDSPVPPSHVGAFFVPESALAFPPHPAAAPDAAPSAGASVGLQAGIAQALKSARWTPAQMLALARSADALRSLHPGSSPASHDPFRSASSSFTLAGRLKLFEELPEALAWAANHAAAQAGALPTGSVGSVASGAASQAPPSEPRIRLHSVPPSALEEAQLARRRALEPLMRPGAPSREEPSSADAFGSALEDARGRLTERRPLLDSEPVMARAARAPLVAMHQTASVARVLGGMVRSTWMALGEEEPVLLLE